MKSALEETGASFSEVLESELKAIRTGRGLRRQSSGELRGSDPVERAHDARLVGVALAGGGIDGTVFQIGALEGIARLGLLRQIDYLACASTGSLAGGWLTAWIKRRGVSFVEHVLGGGWPSTEDERARVGITSNSPAHPDEVSYVRSRIGVLGVQANLRVGLVKQGGKTLWQTFKETAYSLLARVSASVAERILSMPSWVSATAYMRNLLLNLATLVLAFSAVLMVPRLVVSLSYWASELRPMVPLQTTVVALLIAIFFLVLNQVEVLAPRRDGTAPWYTQHRGVQLGVVLPVFVAAWSAGLWMWLVRAAETTSISRWIVQRWHIGVELSESVTWVLLGAVGYFGVWLAGMVGLMARVRPWPKPRGFIGKNTWRIILGVVVSAPLAGAFGGLLLWLIAARWGPLADAGSSLPTWWPLHISIWMVPAVIFVFVVTAFAHVGLSGRSVPESLRLWLNHLLAVLIIYGVGWLGFTSIALLGPVFLVTSGTLVALYLLLGWFGITLVGLFVALRRGPTSEFQQPGFSERFVVSIAPPVFVVGLFLLLSFGIHALLAPPERALTDMCSEFFADGLLPPVGAPLEEILHCHTERLLLTTTGSGAASTPLIFLLLAAAAQVVSFRVDINEFSMSRLLELRLADIFLSASNPSRNPHRLTGHDPLDRIPLPVLAPAGGGLEGDYDGPYPLFVSSVHIRMSPRDQPQEVLTRRRASAPWIWSPLYTGLALKEVEKNNLVVDSYRSTSALDVDLSRAMGVSASGLMGGGGAEPGPFMNFLLSVFAVRPVRWVGNPQNPRTWLRGPRLGLFPILFDLVQMINLRSRYLPVADGASFDPTGVYELVRRRCRVVLVIDGNASPVEAEGAMRLVSRRCFSDLGVEIELDLEPVTPDEQGRTAHHLTIGKIGYPEGLPGTLIYLRRSHTGDEPLGAAPSGWGSETTVAHEEFEALRILGIHVALRGLGVLVSEGVLRDDFEK